MPTSISEWSHGPDTLLRYPEMARYVAAVVAAGAEIEVSWAKTLASITQSDPHLALEMLSRMRGEAIEAIHAIAKDRLNEEDWRLFRAVKAIVSPVKKVRNDFCHHIWGVSPDLPGALLLIPPEEAYALHKRRPADAAPKMPQLPDPDKFKIYYETGLLAAAEAAFCAHRTLLHFSGLIAGQHIIQQVRRTFPDCEDPTVAQKAEFAAQPEVARELAKIDEGDQEAARSRDRATRASAKAARRAALDPPSDRAPAEGK